MTSWIVLSCLFLFVCEDIEVTEKFTYLGSDIHVSACCEPEVDRRLGRVWGVMDSLEHGVCPLSVPVQEDENPIL